MIIVFGAGGFIGTYLVDELLRQGYQVSAADINDMAMDYYKSRGVPYESIDVTNRGDFRKLPNQGVDAVINLACIQPANISEKEYDPIDYINVNVIGILHILEYCRRSKIQKVIAATSHRNTSGLWKEGKKIKETDGRAIDFTGEYAMFSISETAAEDCVEHYSRQYGLQGIVFRFPPVYGYGPHTVIFKGGKKTKTGFQVFIDNVVSGKPIEVWGDPDIGRDIIYVKDVVRAFICALNNRTAKGLYNIGSGRALSLRQQVEETLQVFGAGKGDRRTIFKPELKNSIDPFLYDITKAEKELGWTPVYSFKDLLVDYKKEMESRRFEYLVKKRQQLLENG